MFKRVHGKPRLASISTVKYKRYNPLSDYFMSLGLSDEEATVTHRRLYRDYGLSVRGAAYHYGIDPLDFDSKCDASLPLEELLTASPNTRTLLSQIDRRKVRVWALTNAYKTVERAFFNSAVLPLIKLTACEQST
jgi:hypothetical protein